jgi:signal transduction histidine kinase
MAVMLVALLAVGGATAFVSWGGRLAEQAEAAWIDRARHETLELSSSVDNALLQVEAQLRALATLFYSSDRVEARELLEAEIKLPSDGLGVTLGGLAYATLVKDEDRAAFELQSGVMMTVPGAPDRVSGPTFSHFPISLASRQSDLFHLGADLTAKAPLRSMALTAIRHPENVVMSPAFELDGRWAVVFAIAAPNGDDSGLLVGGLELEDLFERTIRWTPKGLVLRIEQAASSWEIGSVPSTIHGTAAAPAGTVKTFVHRFTHGEARWAMHWHLLPAYQGGVDAVPAWLAGVGGSMLCILIGCALCLLLYQNALIRRRVLDRTAELSEALVAAEQANKSKTNFLAVVGHELRTPLNAVIGFSELLEPLQPNQTARDYVRFVRSGGRHLLKLVIDLLDVAHAEAGELTLNEAPLNLADLIEEVVAEARPAVEQAAIGLTLELEDGLPWVRADAERMRLIALNLLLNALRAAADRGHVTIRAQKRPGDGGVAFSMMDTGPGMTESQVTASLKLFEQIDGPMSRRHEGLGIGLPLCRHLVDLHGGTLTIVTGPGRGTTVTVDLPATRTLTDGPAALEPLRMQVP